MLKQEEQASVYLQIDHSQKPAKRRLRMMRERAKLSFRCTIKSLVTLRNITSVLFISVLLIVFVAPSVSAGNYEKNNSFQAQYALLNQKLYVSVPPSLRDYYGNKSHLINCDSDYAKLVTPEAVKSTADSIRKATHGLRSSDEQFADAVLKLVHQFPYFISGAKYPVETIVDNSGDCVGLSLLAASIMKAGGLDVVWFTTRE